MARPLAVSDEVGERIDRRTGCAPPTPAMTLTARISDRVHRVADGIVNWCLGEVALDDAAWVSPIAVTTSGVRPISRMVGRVPANSPHAVRRANEVDR